jgi:hypothetical protein
MSHRALNPGQFHKHNHPYDPDDPYAMRPEGECAKCDKMREAIRDRLPEDPFEGL